MTFEVEEDSEFVFFTNTEEVLRVDGVARESVQPADACTEVSHAPACELMVGEHMMHLTSASQVRAIVAEAEGGHAGHRH